MNGDPRFSIDIRGEWSHRKAKAVIMALIAEAQHHFVKLRLLDTSTFDKPDRCIITVICASCGQPLGYCHCSHQQLVHRGEA
jgi:hypothetical protein